MRRWCGTSLETYLPGGGLWCDLLLGSGGGFFGLDDGGLLVEFVACLNLDKVALLDALLDGLDESGLVDVNLVGRDELFGDSLDGRASAVVESLDDFRDHYGVGGLRDGGNFLARHVARMLRVLRRVEEEEKDKEKRGEKKKKSGGGGCRGGG